MKVVRKTYKFIVVNLLLTFIFQWIAPLTAWALTGGPSQPEVQSFEPVGTSEMVDLFSGDFTYNIPLMDVGGYPINLSYNSGITMDQEASWVGLGWNINPGVINRGVRGLPDDFSGDKIRKDYNIKDNKTIGISGTVDANTEIVGFKAESFLDRVGVKFGASANLGVFHNNYKGMGLDFGIQPHIKIGANSAGYLTAGLSVSANTQEGIGFSPSVSAGVIINQGKGAELDLNIRIGLPYNSRTGFKQLSINTRLDASLYAIVKNNRTFTGKSRVGGGINLMNGGSTITFGTPTYVPEVTNSMNNFGVTIDVKGGPDFFGGNLYFGLTANYTNQSVAEKSRTLSSYGYLYAQDAGGDQNAMLDFNREKEGVYTPEVANLPITNFTYDVFSATGQGVGGTYRPFRNDVGMVYDAYAADGSGDDTYGLEVGIASTAKIGVNISTTKTQNMTHKWDHTNFNKAFKFQGTDPQNPHYEPVYFKNVGEKTLKRVGRMYDKLGGNTPARIKLNQTDVITPLNLDVSGREELLTEELKQNVGARERRNQPVMVLTAQDAQYYAIDRQIISYKFIEANEQSEQHTVLDRTLPRLSEHRKAKHISEITILRTDGQRYVYGIPAYNTHQKEVTFAISHPNGTGNPTIYSDRSIVKGFDQNSDWEKYASNNNERGNDHLYSATETPPFAHSYLLTTILSPDYVDLTGDGLTPDDLGTGTKINYSRLSDDFQWRSPYGGLSHNEGFKSDRKDDRGSYIYGKKEIWYVHSIESKTHVAVFFVSDRQDGLGVDKELRNDGKVIDPSNLPKLKKVDRVSLYSRQDWIVKGTKSYPIKTAHFVYDYSLCPGIQNHSGNQSGECHLRPGKLTLKALYFTHGFSKQGMLSPYRFKYSDTNPCYHEKKADRWGNYKGQEGNNFQDISATIDGHQVSQPANIFPYVNQDKATTDTYASAWNLEEITLPSGGKIAVSYEADDYAYVQNKQAMQMFKIEAFDQEKNTIMDGGGTEFLYDGNLEKVYLRFNLQEPIAAANPNLLKHYFEGFDKRDNLLYFRCLMDINTDTDGPHYEYVSGYATINDVGLCKANDQGYHTAAWINLKRVHIGDNANNGTINPIVKAGFDYTRQNRQQLINRNDPGGNGVLDIAWGLLSLANDMIGMIGGMNTRLRSRGFCQKVELDQSWIRLNNPLKRKLGGGSRVKRLVLNDRWTDLTHTQTNTIPEKEATYGQVYEYVMNESQSDGTVMKISSGVASYEPILGGDENPFRHPVYTTLDRAGVPSYRVYVEEPFGEAFYPGASVGYRRVVTRSIHNPDPKEPDKPRLKGTAYSGYTVNEFYTAKEYPTFTSQTSVEMKQIKPPFQFNFFKTKTKEEIGLSQGYLVELNDMHGKPKSQATYRDNPTPEIVNGQVAAEATSVSKVEYIYHSEPINIGEGIYKLKNDDILVINGPRGDNDESNDFKIKNGVVGQEEDVILDTRYQETGVYGTTTQINADLLLEFLIPIPLPMIYPSWSESQNKFHSAVLTKVVNRYGILEKTVAYEEGATIETKNILFDAETGEVLVTQTQNEYKDYIYNVSFPSHWAYDFMGQAYKNLQLHAKIEVNNASGRIEKVNGHSNLSIISEFFVPGDEIRIFGKEPDRYWIHRFEEGINPFGVLKIDGNPFTQDCALMTSIYEVEIIRSGRRNMHTLPIQTLTCLRNPIKDNQLFGGLLNNPVPVSLAAYDIIDAQAIEYSDKWQLFCCGARKSRIKLNNSLEDRELRKAFTCLLKHELAKTQNEATYFNTSVEEYSGLFHDSRIELGPAQEVSELNEQYQKLMGHLRQSYNVGQPNNSQFIGVFDRKVNGNKLIITLYNFYNPFGSLRELHGNFFVYMASIFPLQFGVKWKDQSPTFLSEHQKFLFYLLRYYTQWLKKPYFECEITLDLPCGIPPNYDTNLPIDKSRPECSNYRDASTLTGSVDNLNYALIPVNTVMNDVSKTPLPDKPTSTGDFLLKISNTDDEEDGDITWLKGSVGGCFNLFNYRESNNVSEGEEKDKWEYCGFRPNKAANPYRMNVRGAWRKHKALAYYTQRRDNIGNNERSIVRSGGTLKAFESYYNKKNSNNFLTASATAQPDVNLDPTQIKSKDGWIAMERITKFSPWGFELEGKDTLGRYSASVYGYNNLLPVATATNARYQEIAFESFEDYGYVQPGKFFENYQYLAKPDACQPPRHFGLTTKLKNGAQIDPPNDRRRAFAGYDNILTNKESHSGNFCIEVNPIHFSVEGPSIVRLFTQVPACSTDISNPNAFTLKGTDCIGLFNPQPEKTTRYVVSVWVKVPKNASRIPNLTIFHKHGVYFESGDTEDFYTQGILEKAVLKPSGPIIEGWQKIEGEIAIRPNVSLIKVAFNPAKNTDNLPTYFDDFRIHPFEAAMKSYVFDAKLNRLMAELDDRNFATFYEYDTEGRLVRTKKETERGIKTIHESRSHKSEIKP